jgi:cell division transport system permease protein
MRRIFYFVKEALRGFYRAKLMTFVSIITIAVALFALGVAGVGYMSVRYWLAAVLDQPGLIVYIDDAVYEDSSARERLTARIADFPQVQSLSLIGKDSAWTRFRGLYGQEMLEAVDENPFPASLEIALAGAYQSPEAVAELKTDIGNLDGVEGVYYSREWIRILKKMRTWFGLGTMLVVPFLVLALHFMIANTIKLTIYARRDLVTNMRFVGATDFYIKMPFVLEGMLQGMVGGVLGVSALAVLRLLFSDSVLHWGPWYLFLVIFSVGVMFGWIGSMSAVRKFLQ